MTIRHVVLDFDGTCTQVDETAAKYLAGHRAHAVQADPRFDAWWDRGIEHITQASPEAAWHTLHPSPSAPAAADPYILAGEACAWIQEQWAARGEPGPARELGNIYGEVYPDLKTPFRPELEQVLFTLIGRGLHVVYVSNSRTETIRDHLAEHLSPEVMAGITVTGNAGKFRVKPIDATVPAPFAERFARLVEDQHVDGLARPIKLRRGDYLSALANVWGDDVYGPETTLVVGDVYELDLAMPLALGGYAYLVERGPLYGTYAYEKNAMAHDREHCFVRPDLSDLPGIIADINGRA